MRRVLQPAERGRPAAGKTLVVVRHSQRQIHRRQNHEHVSLNDRHAKVQRQKHQRHTPIGISEKNASVTISPANMLAYRRTVRDRTRAKCEMISIGSISGYSHQTGPTNCL